jgi:hypothetical protein
MRRFLENNGLKGYRIRKVPLLTKRHIQSRNTWSQSLLNWGVEEWSRVIFSDESKFHVIGSDGVQYCRRHEGDALLPQFTQKMVKHGGGKVIVWGCITYNGVGRLERINGIMDRHYYVDILRRSMFGTLDDFKIAKTDFVFQHDNDPKHKSKYTTRFLDSNAILVLPWPPNSPDMSPIENVWDTLDRKVHSRKDKATNTEELWKMIQEEWYGLDLEYIQNLYKSMRRRVDALLSAKGGPTKY